MEATRAPAQTSPEAQRLADIGVFAAKRPGIYEITAAMSRGLTRTVVLQLTDDELHGLGFGPSAKTTCAQCNGSGTVWIKRNGRNVETSCKRCKGEGEL